MEKAPSKEQAHRCPMCKHNFSKHSNLRVHLRKFHPDKLEEIAPNKTYRSVAACSVCKTSFTSRSSLRSHVRKYHPGKLDVLAPNKRKSSYQCEKCDVQTPNLKHLKAHRKDCHRKSTVIVQTLPQKCPLCQYEDSESKLLMHFGQIHGISIETDRLEFHTFNDFLMWKLRMEKETNSYFIKKRSSYKTKQYAKMKFYCHRSGTFISKGKGSRKLKRQGSNKINGFCPAILTVIAGGKCRVEFLKTHVGHDRNDLKHLCLPPSERQELASKIAAKVPLDAILEEVKKNCPNNSKRLSLLTKKDLYNIGQSCKAKKVVRQTDDDEDGGNHGEEETSEEMQEEVEETLQLEEAKENLKALVVKTIDDVSTMDQLKVVKDVLVQVLNSFKNERSKLVQVECLQENQSIQGSPTVWIIKNDAAAASNSNERDIAVQLLNLNT